MVSGFPLLFFLSAAVCSSLLVGGLYYYLRTRQEALRWRIEELQEQSAGGALPLLGGDFWDSLLRSTYGAIFGKTWFRQKELELMRAGFRGPRFVKIYRICSLAFTALLLIGVLFGLQGEDVSNWLLGLAGALVLGYFIPEQVLVTLRN